MRPQLEHEGKQPTGGGSEGRVILVDRDRPLSDRERQVVALVADGLTQKEVAVRLGLSFGSAKRYAARAREKLGAKSGPEMVARWLGEPKG